MVLHISKDDTNIYSGVSAVAWEELVRLYHLHNWTREKNSFTSVLEVWPMVLWDLSSGFVSTRETEHHDI